MPSFKSLAILIYREFSVPIIGLRTIEETAVLFPIDKDLGDVSFQSIFIIGKSKDIALRIEKLTASVMSRHADLLPDDVEPPTTFRSQGSTMTGFLSAMEGRLPFRSMSIAFTDDGRSMKSARTPVQGSRGSLRSIGRQHSKNAGDKISPVQTDDDYGDAKSVHEGPGGIGDPLKAKKRVSVINFSALPERGGVTDDEDSDPHLGIELMHQNQVNYAPVVVALSPAELLKKASSPYVPPTARPPGGVEPRYTSQTARTLTYDVGDMSSRSSEPSLKSISTLSSESSRGVNFANRITIHPDAIAVGDPSDSTASGHVHGNRHASLLGNGNGSHAASDPDNDDPHLERTLTLGSDRFPVEMPVIRRQSSKLKDPRLRRISMLRSFRRAPPPADLENHFVVCGTPSNYADFLANLSDLDEPLSTVVFVTPRDLNDKDFQAYQLHKDLYFVRGSPVSMQVFHDARMLFARSILIMSYCATECAVEDENEVEQMDENMADVDAITTHRFISEACQNSFQRSRFSIVPRSSTPFVVAEMIRPSNAKFLIDRSGSLYDERTLENEFRKRELLKDTKSIDECFFSPIYASGRIFFTNTVDALMGSCSQHTLLIDIVTQLAISGNMSTQLPDHASRPRHRLSQIPAPTRFHFHPYSLLVEGMLQEEVC